MARIYRRNLAKDYNCSDCDDNYKKMRHCPFIDKSDWLGNFFIPLKDPDGKDEIILEECPLGFLIKNKHLQIYFECKKWLDKGLPLFNNVGVMELPNKVIEAVNVLDAEFGYSTKEERNELGV